MALLGRFPRGLADEGSQAPLDLDGARPARAVSRTAPGGLSRSRTPFASTCPGQKLHLLISPELASPRPPLIR
jgi:hypothetical protein